MNTWHEATLSYQSYLLRAWQEADVTDRHLIWRFSLEKIGEEDQRHGFSSLQALMAFLEEQVEGAGIEINSTMEKTPAIGHEQKRGET